jgi:tetratricopeptide (TPR) repeat protein
MAVCSLAMFMALTACASGKSIKQGTEEFSIPEGSYHEALSLYDNADYFESIQAWMEVVDNEPRFAQGLFNLGLVYDKLNMVDEAVSYYERAVSAQEETMIEEQGREWKQTRAEADAALAKYNLYLGAAYLRVDLVDEAISTMNKALVVDQFNPTLRYNLAAAYMAKENWDAALIQADIAVDLASRPDAKNNSGLDASVDQLALGQYLLRQAECHAQRAEWEKAWACIDRARSQCKAEPSFRLSELMKKAPKSEPEPAEGG